MADRPGLRRRKPEKLDRENKRKRDFNSGGFGTCKTLATLGLLGTCGLTAFLFYSYVTSPISSIVIGDAHDISKIKWAYINNSDLAKGKKILGELHGPESIAVGHNGTWYTGLNDGRLVKVTDGGKPSQKVTDVPGRPDVTGTSRTKWRPLGLRVHGRKLYVVDAYQGLYSVDLDSWTWEKIVGYDDVSPPMAFPDDLTISKDGKTIYFTDASSRWQYSDVILMMAEGECSGRILQVDVLSKKVKKVRGELCFPNGIQLNPEETDLLVSETSRMRVKVIDISTGNSKKTILLHGTPDNVRPRNSGGYWVAVPTLRDPRAEFANKFPFMRDIAVKLLGHEGLLKLVKLRQGIVVRLNEKYDIESVHYDRDGKVCGAITEVKETESGQLLLGSFYSHGIVTVPVALSNGN